MKIEKLTENKIRIVLNIDELSKKNINIDSLVKNNETSHSFFQTILKEAEKQVGFTTQDCKLFVEAFSTSEGFIVFTLTKYKNEINMTQPNKRVKFKRKSLNNSYKNVIYQFNSFEEFCNFCTYCYNSKLSYLKGFAKNISLYEYNNLYYLVFFNIDLNFANKDLFYASISEFSTLKSTSLVFKSKLHEHGKVIFKANAIKNGIKYFVNTIN